MRTNSETMERLEIQLKLGLCQ